MEPRHGVLAPVRDAARDLPTSQAPQKYYALLGLDVPRTRQSAIGVSRALGTISLDAVRMKGSLIFHRVHLVDGRPASRYKRTCRLLIRCPQGCSFKSLAYLGDTIWALLSFSRGVAFSGYDPWHFVEVPARFLEGSNVVHVRRLLNSREARVQHHDRMIYYEATRPFARHSLSKRELLPITSATLLGGSRVGRDEFRWLLEALPRVTASEDLSRALFFFQESIRIWQFLEYQETLDFFWDGENGEADRVPGLGLDLVGIELSFLSAYKALEALVGDPGNPGKYNAVSKLGKKLECLGLAPSTQLRLPALGTKSICEAILSLATVRDKVVAHGSTKRDKPVTYGQLFAVQRCARYILSKCLTLPFDDER